MQKDAEYLYSLRKYILAVTGIFIFFLIIGVLVSITNPEKSTYYIELFKKTFGWITQLNPFERMLAIFKNNAINSLLALILGIGFGFVPFFLVAVNGLFLGMVAEVFSTEKGIIFVLAAVLPHGIIELPMVFLSAAIGLRLGYEMYRFLKGERTNLKQEFMQGLWFYLVRILPLLFVAAVVESYVTPVIALYFSM
ncbi:MAG: stage II sporulation protein M [Candidatus Methanoperedens sp.]|nr:stage II sporulation protein M [Candidatus Methanoperedens sp.]